MRASLSVQTSTKISSRELGNVSKCPGLILIVDGGIEILGPDGAVVIDSGDEEDQELPGVSPILTQ